MYINVINLETDKSKLYNIVTNFKELNIKYKIFKGTTIPASLGCSAMPTMRVGLRMV